MRTALRFVLGLLHDPTLRTYEVSNRVFTIPNLVTALGIAGTMWYVGVFLWGEATDVWIIPLLHGFVFLTDGLDGWLANRLNQHSWLGKTLDPVRDRVHAAATFLNLGLIAETTTAIWALLIAFCAEFILAVSAYLGGGFEVHAIGKLRAGVHGVAAGIVFVWVYWFNEMPNITFFANLIAAASVVALGFYVVRAYRARRTLS